MIEADLSELIGLGLIVSGPTGIVYSQDGFEPKVEGFLVPYGNNPESFGPPGIVEEDLNRYFWEWRCSGYSRFGIDDTDANFIDSLFEYYLKTAVIVDRSKLSESHYRWIHVTVPRGSRLVWDCLRHILLPEERELKGDLTWPEDEERVYAWRCNYG